MMCLKTLFVLSTFAMIKSYNLLIKLKDLFILQLFSYINLIFAKFKITRQFITK